MAKNVAGKGSVVNPKKPAYSQDQSYDLVENVNQGPSGGKKGKVSAGHNQTSDNLSGKNELIGVNGSQQDPYKAKGSDWPDGKTSADAGHGQGSGATYESPNGGGKNELVTDSENQCGPRFAEDDGPGASGAGTPVPGNRATVVGSNFKVETNSGEGNSDSGEISIWQSVDLQTGYIVGGEQTVVDEVPQFNVYIPSKS